MDRAGALGGIGGGGDRGGAAGLLGPSALELLITANDLHARWGGGGATRPTFTLMDGMEGAKDIASSELPCALWLLELKGSKEQRYREREEDGSWEGRNERVEKVWTHADAPVVDKSVWCQVFFSPPLQTRAPTRRFGGVREVQVQVQEAAGVTMGQLRLVCEVCRDSTWAQHVQTFLACVGVAIVPVSHIAEFFQFSETTGLAQVEKLVVFVCFLCEGLPFLWW